MDIAIIGLGAMGRAIAANLVKVGHRVSAWNRSNSPVEGVTLLETPVEAMQAEMVLTLLSDDDAIRQVLLSGDVFKKARQGVVHVVSSTISVALSRELVALHRAAGIHYVAAPVLGRPDVAAKGELNVLVAGLPATTKKITPALAAISKRIWPMGEEPPMAHAAKIACNMMITMAIEAMAEAVVLTEANGLARDRFFELILNTLFGSRSYQLYSENISNNRYQPGFKASLGLKDLRLAQAAADELDSQLPMLSAVRQQMQAAVENGNGNKDWSVIADHTIRSAKS
nr:NAD(P)-dependent oxidoreductase [Gallaecimonas mangrovi]